MNENLVTWKNSSCQDTEKTLTRVDRKNRGKSNDQRIVFVNPGHAMTEVTEMHAFLDVKISFQ